MADLIDVSSLRGAQETVLTRITEIAKDASEAEKRSQSILDLAEAFAWLTNPAQNHGARRAS